MSKMASAWDKNHKLSVEVISVYDGQWMVRDPWTTAQWAVELSDLDGLWIESEIVDTFDEFVQAFGITDAYFMVAAIVKNSAWAQAIAQQWAGLY